MLDNSDIKSLIQTGRKLSIAIEHYPSRGQTATQELYQTDAGKLFLKRVSDRNHKECQINVRSGTLAEREFWSFKLANAIGLFVPALWLLDEMTTVQMWLEHPDGRSFKKSSGKMEFTSKNVFECALFDWVTGQVDRHDANYLYDYTKKLIVPVDSAHGFLKYEGALPDYLHLYEVGEPAKLSGKIVSEIKAKLDSLSDRQMKNIVQLRNADEMDAILMRKKQIADVKNLIVLLKLYRRK